MAIGWRGQYIRYKGYFLDIVNLYNKRADLRAFLEVILSISTVTIFLVFALKPTALTIISLTKELRDKKDTILLLSQKLTNLKTANTVFSQNESSIPNIDSSVPTSPNPDTISKQILGVASKNSVSVLGISVGQIVLIGVTPVKKGATDVKPLPNNALGMPISISFKGSYENILTFIKDVENLRIPVRIDSLGINSSATDNGTVIVSTLNGRVPYIK